MKKTIHRNRNEFQAGQGIRCHSTSGRISGSRAIDTTAYLKRPVPSLMAPSSSPPSFQPTIAISGRSLASRVMARRG